MEKHLIVTEIDIVDKDYVIESLSNLGYKPSLKQYPGDFKTVFICCNCVGRKYAILNIATMPYCKIDNKELFLALAARTDNEKGAKGEHWVFIGSENNEFIKGKIYVQQQSDIVDIENFRDENNRLNGYYNQSLLKFRKATFDEIVAHYTPKVKKYTGDLKGFPPKALLFLEKQQKAAGNKVDLSVFDKDIFSNILTGGFNWEKIGVRLVTDILINREFDRLDDNGNIIDQQKPYVNIYHKTNGLSSIEDISLIKDIPFYEEEPVKLISNFKPLNISSNEEV